LNFNKGKILPKTIKKMAKVKSYIINPFVRATLTIPAKELYRKSSYEIQPDGSKKPVKFVIDSSPYYRGFISENNTIELGKLSGTATKVYVWAQNHTSIQNEYLFIYPEQFMKINYVKTIKTVRGAISELIRLNILQRYEGKKHCYWYNPEFFNRGNRLTKYKDNVIIKT
jgi:hypothetical protein